MRRQRRSRYRDRKPCRLPSQAAKSSKASVLLGRSPARSIQLRICEAHCQVVTRICKLDKEGWFGVDERLKEGSEIVLDIYPCEMRLASSLNYVPSSMSWSKLS